MEPLLTAIMAGLVVYVVAVALIPRRLLAKAIDHRQSSLDALEQDMASAVDSGSILRENMQHASPLTRAFLMLPGGKSAYARMTRAGMQARIDVFFIAMVLLFVALIYLLRPLGFFAALPALLITFFVGRWYVERRISARNSAFLNIFPEALDMIVRSLRSGYPLAAAVRMVAENMPSPVAGEFKQVADEAAYGSTLVDALRRLSERIDEPDLRFFVVVLAVQQEVGGNLAEVLGNLSSIIRKRKHLRLKIKALTSEGVAAAWVLGMLPLFEFVMIQIFSPNHLTPFFISHLGNMLLAAAIGIVLLGLFIVRSMIKIDV